MTPAETRPTASGTEFNIEVVGLGIGAASESFVRVATEAGYTVVAVGPNRFRLARVFRPTWATVLAAVTAVVAGLGLFFLLVKRTESGEAAIGEDRTGVKLRLTGQLPVSLIDKVRLALSPRGPNSPQATGGLSSFEPPPDRYSTAPTHPVAAVPVAPVGEHVASSVSQTTPRAIQPILALADGRTIVVGLGGVIGRSPSPDPQLPAAALYTLADPSLSKTHLTVGPQPAGVWLLDHHSTNGTTVIVNGVALPCTPGVRVDVPVGAQVVAGELSMVVGAQ